jgi:RNA polymerase sigma factor (sigma-70 family)
MTEGLHGLHYTTLVYPMQPKQHHLAHQFDADMWAEFTKGSEKAFDYLYDKYFALLYGYGMQFCADKAVVKDCVQDLFIELWGKKSKLATVKSVKYYLYKSLRRKVIRVISQKDFLLVEHEMLPVEFNLQTTFSGETALMEKEVIQDNERKIQWALKRLTTRQKEAVFLKFYESLSYHEIASIMNLTDAKYARKLIYRSLVELKTTLFKYKDSLIITSFSLLLVLLLH